MLVLIKIPLLPCPVLRSTVINLDMLTQDHAPARKTKIAVTIGPACRSPEMIEKMVEEGIDIARFKFSHGTPQAHAEVLTTLRKVGAEIVTPPK